MLFQKSFVKLNTKQSIAMARMNPKAVLQGEKPRLIDEWQKAPDIWNQVKDELDFNYEAIQADETNTTASYMGLLHCSRNRGDQWIV